MLPKTNECYHIQSRLCVFYAVGVFDSLVHGFVLLWMGCTRVPVTEPGFMLARMCNFNKTQVLALAPGPVTSVRAFLSVGILVFAPSETAFLKPFPCEFIKRPIQNRVSDVLALVLSKDCFLTSQGAIISHNGFFCQRWRCQGPSRPFSYGRRVKGNFSSILYQFSVHSTNWAHWICETLAVLVWLPYEVSQNSMIVWTNFSWRPGRFIADSLTLFGFANNVCLPDGWFLFAQELWTLAGFRFNQPYPQIILEFRRVLVQQLRLPRITPSKYFLMQRIPGQTRFLQNIGAINQAFQTAFPSLPWTLITFFLSVEHST
jgi:hypothetical protein